jgi:hypothetical protein
MVCGQRLLQAGGQLASEYYLLRTPSSTLDPLDGLNKHFRLAHSASMRWPGYATTAVHVEGRFTSQTRAGTAIALLRGPLEYNSRRLGTLGAGVGGLPDAGIWPVARTKALRGAAATFTRIGTGGPARWVLPAKPGSARWAWA